MKIITSNGRKNPTQRHYYVLVTYRYSHLWKKYELKTVGALPLNPPPPALLLEDGERFSFLNFVLVWEH